MKTRCTSLISLVVLAAGITVITDEPADASVRGCPGRVQLRADTWGQNTRFMIPSGERVPPVIAKKFRLVGTTGYWYCPNGSDKPTKIRNIWIEWCWSYTGDGGTSAFFDGVRFKVAYQDDDRAHSPWSFKVPDDGTIQNCKRQTFSDSHTAWIKPSKSAVWAVNFKFILKRMKDSKGRFFHQGNPWKFFHPENDVVLQDWF